MTSIGTGVNMDRPTKIVPISIPDSHRKRHMFVFGTTGVGKTRLCENLIEQDIHKGYSVVYFDPKGDQQIFTKIFDVARKAERLDELMLVTPIFPEYSAVVDPMAFYFMIDELVGHIISGIQGGKEPFYRNIAKEITTAVITANILLAREEGRLPVMNIDTIRQSIRRDALEQTMNSLRRIGNQDADLTAGMLEDILKSPMEYYAKVSSTLRTALMELSSGNIGKIIGQADSNRFIKRLEAGERVILVVHTGAMITREAAATLGKVLLSMIQSFVGRVYLSNKQKVDPPLSVFIDEAQSILYPGVEDLFAKAGSADVMVTAFAQSVNQVYAVLGEEFGKSILDNTNTKIFMRCSDAETSEYVTRHFGVRNVLTGIYGSNQVTTREVEQDILKVQDILGLQPREFYMLTYSGKFKGNTLNARTPGLKIVFPEAPAVVSSLNSCRPREEEATP
ncbi:MAG TPA: type IV secretion system DNA-binding domain-containing protein [Geobacteraceae bacterium]